MIQHKNIFKSYGFAVNTYDICTENSIIDGKQCTISLCADNNKSSLVNEEVDIKIIETKTEHFCEITVTTEKYTNYWEWT